MKYFCSGRCPRVQRIFVSFLRFLWARKIRVALELIELARVSERENEYFSFKKNIPKIILRWIRRGMMIREANDALGVKANGIQVFKSV